MIRQATADDAAAVAALAMKLWPHHGPEEMEAEYAEMLAGDVCGVFVFVAGDAPAGFAQCQLRRDYVEGSGSSPVGYLEAIWVDAEHRRKGIASELLARCEQWAKTKGCTEFASDCELANTQSERFHKGVGFREANRIICFIKRL